MVSIKRVRFAPCVRPHSGGSLISVSKQEGPALTWLQVLLNDQTSVQKPINIVS